MKRFLMTFAVAAVVSASAQAATVSPVTGKVSANFGSGFKVLSGSTTAEPGTRVMAAPNSEGLIQYENGCYAKVKPGRVYIVDDNPVCGDLAGLGDGVGGTGLSTTALVVGGVVIGGGVAAAIALSDDDDRPASP